MKTPLFSTYHQGENRVTSSIVAVFERIGIGRVEQLLRAASDDADLEMIRFKNQLSRGDTVPDASISADFHFLFEVKTARSAVNADQLRRHLGAFDSNAGVKRLFVLTPDSDQPNQVTKLADARVTWLSFAGLDDAIQTLLEDKDDPLSEREEFLLRDLRNLLDAEGLTAPTNDTLVIPARFAYDSYLKYHAYICQARRSFRPDVKYLGFYLRKEIRPEIAQILWHQDEVPITMEQAEIFRADESPASQRLADLIESVNRDDALWAGNLHQVFLLSAPHDNETIRLDAAIKHEAKSAWVQGQRYTSSKVLRTNPVTTVDL